jgi:predicted Zn-dependent peptidase
MGNIGAEANAYTSEESTVYYSSVLPEYFDRMFELLADMLQPALPIDEFATEKQVILEEIALYQDKPHFYLFEHANRDYFRDHPAGNSVLGSAASVGALTRDGMRAYFNRRYSASNMALAATGNFDWERFVADAERYCSGWPSFPCYRTEPRKVVYRKKNTTQGHVILVSEGVSSGEDERFPLAVLSTIIGDSSGSKLYWALVDTGIAEYAASDSEERDGTGCFVAYASAVPERLDEVAAIMSRILEDRLAFTDADLARAKTKLASKIALGNEVPSGRLMSIGGGWIARGRPSDPRWVIDRLQQVTRGEIEQMLHRYPLRDWCEYRLLPEE